MIGSSQINSAKQETHKCMRKTHCMVISSFGSHSDYYRYVPAFMALYQTAVVEQVVTQSCCPYQKSNVQPTF